MLSNWLGEKCFESVHRHNLVYNTCWEDPRLDHVAKVRQPLQQMLNATSIDEQNKLFESGRVRESIWRPTMRWLVRREMTMTMLGVPRSQREQIDHGYVGGLEQFIIHSLDMVFTQLSLADNYFWRVYLTGQYSESCCPEYLKEENFNRLRNGLVDRISTHTDSVDGFLKKTNEPISRFVLLDHMDWLCKGERRALASEWQAIVNRCTDNAKVLWRSAGLNVDFVDSLRVSVQGTQRSVGELLNYNRALASSLHLRDRVHTYGSFYIADLNVA